MSDQENKQPVQMDDDEPTVVSAVRFGRHPADSNVIVHLPKLEASVGIALSPAVNMSKDFLDNYHYYVCVVTSLRQLNPDEVANAVVAAAEYIGVERVMPLPTPERQTSDLIVLWQPGYPRQLEEIAAGIFTEGALLAVEVSPETYKATTVIVKMAGIAATAAGRAASDRSPSSEVANNIVGRRLSDAMPPNNSSH